MLVLLAAIVFRKQVQNVVKVLVLALHSFAEEYNSSYIEKEEDVDSSDAFTASSCTSTAESVSPTLEKATKAD